MATHSPTATIDQLIISSPYDEPTEHWKYDRETRRFTRESGRRPAGYVRASDASKSFDDPGEFVELPLVNKIRPRVDAWRSADYPGACGPALASQSCTKERGRRCSEFAGPHSRNPRLRRRGQDDHACGHPQRC